MNAALTVDLADYHEEVAEHLANRPADYHPATSREPRRVLTFDGQPLAGAVNGHCSTRWNSRRRHKVHVAVSGWGYAYGAAVAACNGDNELGERAEDGDFVMAAGVDKPGRCQRPGCRQAWPA